MCAHLKIVSGNDKLDTKYKYLQHRTRVPIVSDMENLSFSGFPFQRGEKGRTRNAQVS